MAALVPDMFSNFYFVKNQKIANNSATTEAAEKYAHIWNPLKYFDACLTKVDNYQALLNKTSHRFLETIKLFSG